MDGKSLTRALAACLAGALLFAASLRADLPDPIKTFKHDAPVDVLAFSPDGKILAVGSRDSTISLWKLGSDKEPRRLTVRVGRFLHLAFSPDGKFLASSGGDGRVRLWAVATGEEVSALDENSATSLHFGV